MEKDGGSDRGRLWLAFLVFRDRWIGFPMRMTTNGTFHETIKICGTRKTSIRRVFHAEGIRVLNNA
jgi:hypothetical protein